MKIYSSFNASKNKNFYKQPFYKSKRFYLILIFFFIIFLFFYWSITKNSSHEQEQFSLLEEKTDETYFAQIDYIEGSLSLANQDNGWDEINSDTQITSDKRLLTGPQSKAIIVFPDGSIIRLDENTEIILQDFNQADINVNLISGRIFNRVANKTSAIYRVICQETEIIALGTAFNITLENKIKKIFVTENKVKIKVYDDESLDNIRNMRTIDQGYYAQINPSLKNNTEIIDSEEISLQEIENNEWLSWNKQQDKGQNFYLGIYEESLPLTLSYPKEDEFETDEATLQIKGATEKQAKIFINGNDVENQDGLFTHTINLEKGKNTIEISVIKEKSKNKKTLYVQYKSQEDPHVDLTAQINQNQVILNWKIENYDADYGFRTLISESTNPEFPQNKFQIVPADTFMDTWNDLENKTYNFRVCVYENQNCVLYSNNVSVKIENSKVHDEFDNPEIVLSASEKNDSAVLLSWQSTELPQIDNFHILIDTNEEPTHPKSSTQILSSDKKTTLWDNLVAGKYYFRVCAFKNNQCVVYSNIASIQINEIIIDEPTSISLNATATPDGIKLSWQAKNLTSDKGFYALMSTNNKPLYPSSEFKTLTSPNDTNIIWQDLDAGNAYHFVVCENIGNACGTYSNEVIIIAP